MKLRNPAFALAALMLAAAAAAPALAEVPIVTDSRIKTLVYNANEVFTITTHYGYQSNIEFSERETIETVSVGDRVAWQIVPAGRRLFIRAQEENAHTNMTVITSRHAYQFDLRSSSADAVFGSEELTYVVRFFYPGEANAMMPAVYVPPMPTVTQSAPQAPVAMAPMPVSTAPASMPTPTAPNAPITTAAAASSAYNYRYTFSGPSTAAPVKIYDDSRSTFFKFRDSAIPQFSVITARGEELSVPARRIDGNTYAVDAIAPRFSLRSGAGQVIVYNESNGA